jgi:hypothetical protein
MGAVPASNASRIVDVLGFPTGTVLYLMLVSMAFAIALTACQTQGQLPESQSVAGTIGSCASAAGVVSVEIRTPSGLLRFSMSENEAPWPSADYAKLIRTRYVLLGPCPAAGEQVLAWFAHGSSPPAACTIELGGHGESFDETRRSLWLYRQFADELAGRSEESDMEFHISGVLARYNRADGGHRRVWVRGLLRSALSAYSAKDRAEVMIQKFGYGNPDLAATIAPVRALYAGWTRDQQGLVMGLPYIPEDPRSFPYIGAWGVFPVEIYAERDNALKKVY